MFKRMNFSTKLRAVFTAIALSLAVLLVSVILLVRESASHSRALAELRLPNTHSIAVIKEQVGAVARYLYGAADAQLAPEVRREQLHDLERSLQTIAQQADAFDRRAKDADAESAWKEARQALVAWGAEASSIRSAIALRDTSIGEARVAAEAQVYERIVASRGPRKRIVQALQELDERGSEAALLDAEGLSDALRFIWTGLMVVVVGIIALSAASFIYLRRELSSFLGLVGDNLLSVARGDLPEPIVESRGADFNELRDALNQVSDAIRAQFEDLALVASAAKEGRLDQRANAHRHRGAYRRIVESVNSTITTLVGHLDRMPAPAVIMDREFKVRYFNASALQVVGMRLDQVVGEHCYDLFKTEDCRTERCACARAMAGDREASSQTIARPGKAAVEIAYSGVPLHDDAGQVIGALEVISDQTAVRKAMRQAQKVADYQSREATAVVGALEKLAAGDLNVALCVGEGDADTDSACRAFKTISCAIGRTAEAVRALARDTTLLSSAAVEGRLSVRADASAHHGDYRAIVQGVNETLDAVGAPMKELAGVLDKLASGVLSTRTEPGHYQNEARALVQGINETLDALLAPAEEATQVMGDLAERNLTARMSGSYTGEHAKLKNAVNATAAALNDAIAQVAEAVEQVSSASTQIAASSQAVASGASQQAASLEETSTSLESMLSLTRQATENAQQANTLTQAARAAARDGASAVDQMQGAMGKVKASAERTSQIIKDINDIAFQTNLLALNAAVEAARAGDAGRGFAVVAEEVRSLALRAKDAAAKTEELIRESVRQAGEGELTSREVAGKLSEIVAGVGKASDIVGEIATAARAQATGFDQINRAVTEMDKVTQQNAASAEESSSAASELSGQAEELAAMVGAFQVSRNRLAQPSHAPAAARIATSPSWSTPATRSFVSRSQLPSRAPLETTPATESEDLALQF